MKKILLSIALIVPLSLMGCATILSDKTQLIPISSTPGAADIVITDERSARIFEGKTPAIVTLPKSDGSYFGGKDFIVKITKAGYQPQSIPVKSKPNGWYIAGNLVFGGLIGWLVVDPLTGAMYTLSPEQISAALETTNAHNNQRSGEISIVLLQDVPDSLKSDMTPLHSS